MKIYSTVDREISDICYADFKKIPDKLNIKKVKTVLDLGGATGAFSGKLKAKNNDIFCINIDLNIKDLKQGKNVEPVQGNILHLPFKDKTFDIVLATAVLHHVPEDLDTVFSELKRVIKDQGFLLIEEPGFLNPPAYFARKFLPSTMHDPNEKPIIPKTLKNKVSKYFSIKELKHYCIFSYITPYLIPKLSEKSKPFARKISSKIYTFDNILLKSIFFQNFCGYVYILAQKI